MEGSANELCRTGKESIFFTEVMDLQFERKESQEFSLMKT